MFSPRALLARLCSRHSMFQDLVQTVLINLLVLVLSLVTYGIVARRFEIDDVGLYMLLRRLNQSLNPIVSLGMSIALTRYMAMESAQGRAGRYRLLLVTTLITVAACGIFSLLFLVWPGYFSQLILGHSKWGSLMPGLVLIVVGTVMYSQVFAYFRGRIWASMTNLMQLLCLGLVPIIAVPVFAAFGVRAVLEATGAGFLGLSLLFLLLAAHDARLGPDEAAPAAVPAVKKTVAEMLRYGLPRLPSFVAMALIWLAGPLLATRLGELSTTAYLATGVQLLQVASIPFSPLGYVFLPRFAEMMAKQRVADMRRLISLLGSMAVQMGLLAATQLIMLLPVLLRVWMKFTDPRAVYLMAVLALSIPAYLLFEVMRNPLDSYSAKPYNTWTIIGSLALLGLLAWILHALGMPPAEAAAWATSMSIILMGSWTSYLASRLYGSREGAPLKLGYFPAVLLAAFWALVAFGLRVALNDVGAALVIPVAVAFECIVIGSYLWVLYKLKVAWVSELAAQVKQALGR